MTYKTKGKVKDLDIVIGKNLLYYRIKSGLSQGDTGKAVNISFQQVQKYETGKNRIAASTLYALAEFLNISVNQFYGDSYDHIFEAKTKFIDTIIALDEDEWNKFTLAFEYAMRVVKSMS